MIKTQQFGPVKQYLMGRIMDGQLIRAMACYYVDGLLVDSGPIHVAHELPEIFAEVQVKVLVNTHHHEDHIGNNLWFQKALGLGPALAHSSAVPLIERQPGSVDPLPLYRRYTWGEPPASRALAIDPELRTPNYLFKVIETPGHSPDHICLLEPEQGWLFTGDLYLGEKVSEIHMDEDPNLILNSLMGLLRYDFEVLFCSSGKVLEINARQAVVAKIAYWEEERDKVRCLYRKGYQAEEIRERLYGPESPRFERCDRELGKIHLVNAFIRSLAV